MAHVDDPFEPEPPRGIPVKPVEDPIAPEYDTDLDDEDWDGDPDEDDFDDDYDEDWDDPDFDEEDWDDEDEDL
jgi:hypothetical protein